jgi:hypothetical protein
VVKFGFCDFQVKFKALLASLLPRNVLNRTDMTLALFNIGNKITVFFCLIFKIELVFWDFTKISQKINLEILIFSSYEIERAPIPKCKQR